MQWILSKDEGKKKVKQKSKEPGSCSLTKLMVIVLHTVFATNTMNHIMYDMAKALLEAGADPNELNSEDYTPLMILYKQKEVSLKKKDTKWISSSDEV